MRLLELLSQRYVIVNLPINSEDQRIVLVRKRLSARVNADNRQTFVAQNVFARDFHAGPIGAAIVVLDLQMDSLKQTDDESFLIAERLLDGKIPSIHRSQRLLKCRTFCIKV
jgi:hypothetical protein